MHDPSWLLVAGLLVAAVVLNTVGYAVWKRGIVGQWFSAAVGVASLVLLIGGDTSPALISVAVVALLGLGAYAGRRWIIEQRPSDRAPRSGRR